MFSGFLLPSELLRRDAHLHAHPGALGVRSGGCRRGFRQRAQHRLKAREGLIGAPHPQQEPAAVHDGYAVVGLHLQQFVICGERLVEPLLALQQRGQLPSHRRAPGVPMAD